ncbi:MAG: hypothetical protein HY084_06420 [Gemmatimonadetes bacterium]|nr:hypothetical protein [Gemmatimonadota bacterium]
MFLPLRRLILRAALLLAAPGTVFAQGDHAAASDNSSFWTRWIRRSERNKAEQPHWLTPIATTTPRLEQELRYDIDWSQARPGMPYTTTFGNTKGLELIPFDDVEIIFGIPSYVAHGDPAVSDGWGDAQLLVKYRLLAADQAHGDYILTVFLSSSFPTATEGNGQPRAIVTPTVAYGKGWGDFDIQGTLGVTEPVGSTSAIGRTYIWNHTFQFHALEKVWPELEVNQAWFSGGRNDGKSQTFLTPGVVIGRLPVTEAVGLTVGVGVQIAVSAFHTANHNYILSLRAPF